jgi:hypothetical protein
MVAVTSHDTRTGRYPAGQEKDRRQRHHEGVHESHGHAAAAQRHDHDRGCRAARPCRHTTTSTFRSGPLGPLFTRGSPDRSQQGAHLFLAAGTNRYSGSARAAPARLDAGRFSSRHQPSPRPTRVSTAAASSPGSMPSVAFSADERLRRSLLSYAARLSGVRTSAAAGCGRGCRLSLPGPVPQRVGQVLDGLARAPQAGADLRNGREPLRRTTVVSTTSCPRSVPHRRRARRSRSAAAPQVRNTSSTRAARRSPGNMTTCCR